MILFVSSCRLVSAHIHIRAVLISSLTVSATLVLFIAANGNNCMENRLISRRLIHGSNNFPPCPLAVYCIVDCGGRSCLQYTVLVVTRHYIFCMTLDSLPFAVHSGVSAFIAGTVV